MKKVCWLITIFLSIALVFLPFSSFAAEINSDEMMQLILQMLGIDEETANSMAPDELQELVNQMMNGDTSSAKEEVQAVQNTEDIFADKYLTDAGFRVLDDVFAGQKVYYQPNSNVSLLTYSTKTLFWGMNVDTKIFGEDAKEDGDLPAWTEGDTSEFHDKQKKIGFYPCVVYNMRHSVPYSFVVSISFPRSGKNNWLGMQNPWSVMIATDQNVYSLNRYLPAAKSWYAGILFMTVDEKTIEMFKDMKSSNSISIRATAHDAEYVDFSIKSDCVDTVLAAWDLYEQAGGTRQDLSCYNNSIDVRNR